MIAIIKNYPSNITCQRSTSVTLTNPDDVEDAVEDFVNNATTSAPFLGDHAAKSFNKPKELSK